MGKTETSQRGIRKTRQGMVVRKSGNMTIVVVSESRRKHPIYGKIVRYTSKYHVHDEKNEASVGDNVCIVESRPLSRMKRWRLLNIVEKLSS